VDSEAEATFQKPKEALCAAAHSHARERFVIDTDASTVVIGGALSQVQDGKQLVIACYSKTLNKAERNYCVTLRELLAIMRMLGHFHKYLY
jgi:hypothetical protein